MPSQQHNSFYFIIISVRTDPVMISEHNYMNMNMTGIGVIVTEAGDIMWIIIIVLSCELIGRLFLGLGLLSPYRISRVIKSLPKALLLLLLSLWLL